VKFRYVALAVLLISGPTFAAAAKLSDGSMVFDDSPFLWVVIGTVQALVVAAVIYAATHHKDRGSDVEW
jgi:hypothetical protein